ncbi:uncharacterized protein BDW47DRAFT_101771 [Aspergillus candidus]|uniref:Uncharacterized protein n=1 Tax=Aspergillus candidus TaxID=41067 RepID=A0A2I2FI65_ASPCN|nr:hypothetical protein BDW47DRAFT_101771 [Aspergillus candidus]PLB40313.1 hypothetical protein BDW47DRAFT_101771 [Aspergillus candidus]
MSRGNIAQISSLRAVCRRARPLGYSSFISRKPLHITTSRQIVQDKRNLQATFLDRSSLHPERAEYTESGTDSEAGMHRSSYDPAITSPELESRASEEECKLEGEPDDPLFISPANTEVSRMYAERSEHIGPTTRLSGKGWTRKHLLKRFQKTG